MCQIKSFSRLSTTKNFLSIFTCSLRPVSLNWIPFLLRSIFVQSKRLSEKQSTKNNAFLAGPRSFFYVLFCLPSFACLSSLSVVLRDYRREDAWPFAIKGSLRAATFIFSLSWKRILHAEHMHRRLGWGECRFSSKFSLHSSSSEKAHFHSDVLFPIKNEILNPLSVFSFSTYFYHLVRFTKTYHFCMYIYIVTVPLKYFSQNRSLFFARVNSGQSGIWSLTK